MQKLLNSTCIYEKKKQNCVKCSVTFGSENYKNNSRMFEKMPKGYQCFLKIYSKLFFGINFLQKVLTKGSKENLISIRNTLMFLVKFCRSWLYNKQLSSRL